MGSLSKPGNERPRQLSLEWWSVSFQKTLLEAQILSSCTLGTSREESQVSCWWEAELRPSHNSHLGTCSKLFTLFPWRPSLICRAGIRKQNPFYLLDLERETCGMLLGTGIWRLTPLREKRNPLLRLECLRGGRLRPGSYRLMAPRIWMAALRRIHDSEDYALSAATAPVPSRSEPLLKCKQKVSDSSNPSTS